MCILLCLMLIFSIYLCSINADQLPEDYQKVTSQMRFTYISTFVNSINISQYGYTTTSSYLYAPGVDQVKLNVYLQQFKDGYWQTIKSWSNTRDGDWNSLATGWYVTSGYLYRCITYGYVYIDGYVVESDCIISSLVYY